MEFHPDPTLTFVMRAAAILGTVELWVTCA